MAKSPSSRCRALAAFAGLLLVATSCGLSTRQTAGEPSDAAPNGEPPATLFVVDKVLTWTTEEGFSERSTAALPILVPNSDPNNGIARLELQLATAGDQPDAVLMVRWDDDQVLSVSTAPGEPNSKCVDRTDADWTSTAVRGHEGCHYLDGNGLYSLTWHEDGARFVLQTHDLDQRQVIDYLATWSQL